MKVQIANVPSPSMPFVVPAFGFHSALFASLALLCGCGGCKNSSPPVEPKVEADGHYLAATAAYLKGNFQEAHGHFDEVRRLAPDDQRLPFAEGELLMVEQRTDEAIARFEASLKLEPKRSTTWSRLGLLYAIKEQKEKSADALARAIELNPKDFNAHELLGDAALERGDLDEAVRRFLLASDTAPEKVQAQLVVKAAKELVKAKRPSRALEVLEHAKASGIDSKDLNQELGDRLVEMARWDDAIVAYTAVAEDDASAWELVAELEFRGGRLEKAEAAWAKAIAGKDQALYHVGLGRVCLARKDRPCAEAQLEKALATATGEEVRETMELADFLSMLGRKSDGLKLLEAVASEEEQEKNVLLQLTLARAAKVLGRSDVVKNACERIAPARCP
jgi:tetratricopeptide (TPR) repeat protein